MSRLEAIADPVRLAVARHLTDSPGASAQDVARAVGIHLNTARAHLAALTEAGLARRLDDSRGRRGRPVVRYRLADGWAPAGDELLPLAELLAAAVLSADPDPERLREVARDWGRRQAAANPDRPVEERLVAALSRLGFHAELRGGRLHLSACPCPLVSPADPALVCGLADAAADGALEGSRLARARPRHDPRARRCSAALVPA